LWIAGGSLEAASFVAEEKQGDWQRVLPVSPEPICILTEGRGRRNSQGRL